MYTLKILFLSILIIFLSKKEVSCQTYSNNMLVEFLIEQEELDSKKDSVNIYKVPLLNKGNCLGVYKFGVTSAHHTAYYFIINNCNIEIIKSSSLDAIFKYLSIFMLNEKSINDTEKLEVYKGILEYYEGRLDSHPWTVKEEDLLKN